MAHIGPFVTTLFPQVKFRISENKMAIQNKLHVIKSHEVLKRELWLISIDKLANIFKNCKCWMSLIYF